MSHTRVRTAVAAAFGLAVSGGLTGLVAAPAQATVAPTISVFITAGHTIKMTHHMHPGGHRFKVGSAKAASFQIVRPRNGYTKAMLVKDVANGLAAQDSSTPKAIRAIKHFEAHVTLLGGVSSAPHHRGVMWANLTRGTYWMADTMPPVPAVEDILTVHVGGARVAGTLPSGKTIRAIDEATWASTPRSIPHKGVVRFVNDSTDNHFVTMAKLLPGKTVADFRRWVDQIKSGQNPGPPPFDERVHGIDTGVVSPGHRMAIRYDIPRGRYVLLCFWPDAEHGGMPHAFMGMFRGIRVR
ncbi:MAG: hypothetical protein ACXVX8_20370 [Blastococcus sp.]